MPRVSDDYRRARRDEIARAAIRCLERKGVHDTSIADIVEESGLSTGAIYSHFTARANSPATSWPSSCFRGYDLERSAESARPRTARDDAEGVQRRRTSHADRRAVLGRGTVGGEMREEMMHTAARLRETIARALLPWARTRTYDGCRRPRRSRGSGRARSPRSRRATSRTPPCSGPASHGEYVDSVVAALT